MLRINPQSGLIKLIVIIVIAVLILSYFSIDLKSIVESEQSKKNFSYITNGITYVWDKYLSKPTLYFWNNIFIGILWETFKGSMDNIKNGEPTNIQRLAPNVDLYRPGTVQ